MIPKKIVILGTGGTIAGLSGEQGDNVGYKAAQVGVDQLVTHLALGNACVLHTEQVAQIDSKDMVFSVWQALVQRIHHWVTNEHVDGVVITHGTDTLEETAYFLHCVVQTQVPIVFACAMRPASSLSPDGPQNMRDAVALSCHPGVTGVSVVCAGSIHAAGDVQKLYPYRVDAFSSGDAGVLGYIEEGRVRQCRPWQMPLNIDGCEWVERIPSDDWPYVEIITSYAGCTGAVVDALMALEPRARPRGLVVAATGNGTVHASLIAALDRAVALGVPVVISSRCALGTLVPGGGESPVKARIALVLKLLAWAAPR